MSQSAKASPSLVNEQAQLACHALVGGMDEVGRGALAGPVCVGLALVDATTAAPPAGLRDSKLLTAPTRQALVPSILAWATNSALGWSGPREIDQLGIIGALHLAGQRALAALLTMPTCLLLDGKHDWLSCQPDLTNNHPEHRQTRVVPLVKADQNCASVAAASVLAKVARDRLMTELDATYPAYGLAANKGYGSARHRQAIASAGPSLLHRTSWALLGRQNAKV